MVSKFDRKICGTCLFWRGHREQLYKPKPKVIMFDEEGVCECPISSKSGEQRKKDNTCNKHSCWIENL